MRACTAQSNGRLHTGMFRCSLFRQKAFERLRSFFPSLDSVFTSYRVHEPPSSQVAEVALGCSRAARLNAWASSPACIRLSVFVCLYLFVCGGACVPCFTPPRQPYGYRSVSARNLYNSSLVKLLLSIPVRGTKPRESTAYSQETAPPPARSGLSGYERECRNPRRNGTEIPPRQGFHTLKPCTKSVRPD